MTLRSESDLIEHSHNTARFFTENRQISLILLLGRLRLGLVWLSENAQAQGSRASRFGWRSPARSGRERRRKRWSNWSAGRSNRRWRRTRLFEPPSASDFGIRSLSFPGLSLVYIQLDDSVKDTKKQFSDINLKLDAVSSRLPQGAGPIQFNSDFGDTSALMLTVASPPATAAEIAVRAHSIRGSDRETSDVRDHQLEQPRVSVVYSFPQSVQCRPGSRHLRAADESCPAGEGRLRMPRLSGKRLHRGRLPVGSNQ